jgi:hypothetical protein
MIMENKNDFQWDLMIAQLRGIQLNNFGLHQIAALSCGDVVEAKQYLKLTERLYTPTVMEKFASL